MAPITIPAQSIVANVEKHSPATTIPANVSSVLTELTDPNNVWNSTVGNIIKWGVQRSTDNGATWNASGDWFQFASGIPFGTPLARVAIRISATDAQGNPVAIAGSGDQLRLAILTDTDIALGAKITAS